MADNRSISEQLNQLQPAIRGSRPFLRKAFEITAPLCSDSGAAVAVEQARRAVLTWMQERSGRLPDKAWEFESFDLDQAVAPATVIAFKGEHDLWAARLDDADRSMPGRSWTTEVMVVLSSAGEALFGARLMVSTRGGDLPFQHSTPGLVRQVISQPGLLDAGRSIRSDFLLCSTHAEVRQLVELIEAQERQLPIFAVSLPSDSANPKDAALDVERLAHRCAGIGHVVVLPGNSTYHLTEEIGKEYSVFNGAVRTYRPNFNPDEDHPYNHPLALAQRVQTWGERGPVDFCNLLINSAYQSCVARPDADNRLPRFSAVRAFVLKQKRERAEADRNQDDLLELALEENQQISRERDEWEELAQSEQIDREQAEKHVKNLEQELFRLRSRIGILEDRIEVASGASIDADAPIPNTLNDLQSWADQNVAGRLVITGRASRAAKDAVFRDVELVYQALLLLANEYRHMRVGGGDEARNAFNDKCSTLGLNCSQTFSGSGAGEFGDEYFITWNRQRQPFDIHLKNGGNTRDPARCLRIYFFWDDNDQQVVIGSLPAHLRHRLS